MSPPKPLHYSRRFPAEIISQSVWLYFRVFLGYQDIEEMIAERAVIVTYKTSCNWLKKLRGTWIRRLRSRQARPGVHQHLDEVFHSIKDKLLYRRRTIIIAKPRDYVTAKAVLLPDLACMPDERSKNRAWNFHDPAKGRERSVRGLNSRPSTAGGLYRASA